MTHYQNEVQKKLAKIGDCPTCDGLGTLNFPAGPVRIGAKPPTCNQCGGTGHKS